MTQSPKPNHHIRSWSHEAKPGGKTLGALFGVGISAAAGLSGTVALAQDTTTDLGTIHVQSETGDEVKVEASADPRMTAPLVDTPKTVTVIPKKILEQRGQITLEEVFRATPGITMGSGEGGQPNADRPVIRGFNAETNVLVDGIRDPGAQSRGTFNLEQVEVTKGADSVFAGRGGAGGSINLVTKRARADEFNEATLTYGTDDKVGASIDSNFVMSDTVAARINFAREYRKVPGRDGVFESSFGGAATVTFGLGTPLRTTLSYSHYEEDNMPDYGIPWLPVVGGLPTTVADVSFDNFYGLKNRDFQKSKNDTVSARVEYDISPSLRVSNTLRYSRAMLNYIATNPDDSRGNVPNGYVWRNAKSRNSETQSWYNVTQFDGETYSGEIKHSFAAGIEVGKETSRNQGYSVATGSSTCDASTVGAPSNYNCTDLYNPDPNDPWSGTIVPSTNVTKGHAETFAVYAFDTVEFNDQWLANFGLRWDHFRVSRETGSYDGSNNSRFWTYQLGLVYKPAPNGSIYVSYATSAAPAGLSNGDGDDNLSVSVEDLEPVTTKSIEVGTKWDLFNDRLSFTAAAFQNFTDNARVTVDSVQQNVGETRVRGVELGLAGNVTDRWSVFGGYTFLDSELVDDGDAANEGNELPNTPRHSFSIWSTYEVSPKLTMGGGAIYRSSQFGDTANLRKVDSYWRVDAMAEYRIAEHASLRLNVNNLFDERYIERFYSTHYAVPAEGRSASLTLSMDF